MELNAIQKAVAENIDDDIVLMAGAGTGKTQVLTNRFLNILRSGEAIENILAITFTKKAAAEMKLKIKRALLDSDAPMLRERQKYISKASIYTIHGFCSELISKYPIDVGIDPEYKVIESQDSTKLLKNSIKYVLNKNIDELHGLMFETKNITTEFLESELMGVYYEIKNLGYTLEQVRENSEKTLESLKKLDFSKLIELLNEYSAGIVRRNKFKDFTEKEEYINFLNEPNIDFLEEIKNNLGTSTKQSEVIEEIKEEILKLQMHFELKNVEYINLVLKLISEVDKEYRIAKDNINVLDYDDLQEYAIKILETVKLNYKYVMVDEFQDTNHIQTKILDVLREKNKDLNLFVVGDPKQSIYSFRGGSIQTYRDYIRKMQDRGAKIFELSENYRSSKKLIESYNVLFESLMGDEYSKLNYNIDGEEKFKILESEDEIKSVADYVENLIESGISQGEIALIYRKKKNMAAMEKELVKRNIEVSNTATMFCKNREIQDIIITLKAIYSSEDIVSYLSYLKTPEAGLSEDAIFLLANEFVEYREWGEDFLNILSYTDREKFNLAVGKLENLREYSKVLSISNLVEKIILELDFYEIAYYFKGETGVKNLKQLILYAINYECTYSSNILDFVEYIEDLEIEQEPSNTAVNLITTHKSKGLEYDYVILMDSDKPYKMKNGNFLLQVGKMGIGINIEGRNSIFKINKRENELKQLEEELRIFYVACTRAKKVLVFVYNSNLEKTPDKTYKKLLFESDFDDLEYLDFEVTNKKRRVESFISKLKSDDELSLYQKTLIRDNYYAKTRISEYYSVSQYMLFREDKDLYFKRYVLGNDVKLNLGGSIGQIDPIIKGNIIHKYAEKPKENIDLFVEDELKRYGIEYDFENVLELKELIEYYNQNSRYTLYKEWEFYLSFGNSILHGFIDEVRQTEDGIEIIDIKTGRMNKEKIDHYSLQLQIYSYAYSKITGNEVKSAKLLSLADKKEYEIDVCEEVLKERIADFKKFVEEVQN